MCSRDCSTAMCCSWLILTGSTRLNTPPTPARASASVTCPSESNCTCCSFSGTVIFPTSALTFCSIPASAASGRAAASAASSLDWSAARTAPPPTNELNTSAAAATSVVRLPVLPLTVMPLTVMATLLHATAPNAGIGAGPIARSRGACAGGPIESGHYAG